MRKPVVGLDFDGTLVTHEYPGLGRDIGAFPWLHKLKDKCHFILFTMRSDDALQEAVEFIESNEIFLFGVNVNPTQHNWTNSPKAYCQIYVDDAALGIPLVYPGNGRPFVDWEIVGPMLEERVNAYRTT